MNTKTKFTKEVKDGIKQLLLNGLSAHAAAKSFGVGDYIAQKCAKELGIKLVKGKGKSEVYVLKEAPNDLKQLIIGSLLGDGTFSKGAKTCVNYYLGIAHCMEQLDYMKFKFNILKKYNLATKIKIRTYTDRRFKNPTYTECRINTRNNPLFTYIRNNAYIDGKKIISFPTIEDIDPLGLAIWYMDDGHVTKSSCVFSTCSFDESSQQRLADFLLGRFGLHFTVGHNENSLYLLHEDFEKFKSIVSPYILPILQYKLVPYKERVLYKSDELLETCEETYGNQQPSTSLTTCEGSETNS